MDPKTDNGVRARTRWAARIAETSMIVGAVALVAASAIAVKHMQTNGRLEALASFQTIPQAHENVGTTTDAHAFISAPIFNADDDLEAPGGSLNHAPVSNANAFKTAPLPKNAGDASKVRWFNGRPIRPARVIWMTVTAYSPDERSCPGTADGITSSLHSVWTNGMKLVAADSRLLPLGSMVSVPGYDENRVVPVLDRGGKIKGRRLDVLYPTHEIARKWGVKKLPVTVWEYADGKPADNWRAIRDSR